MLRVHCVGNTASVGELQVREVKGANGETSTYQSIIFRVATRRDFYTTRQVNGEIIKERQTDFYSCKATGALAKVIADYASDKKEDGKLVSRLVELHGHMETYKAKRTETKTHQFMVGEDLCEAEIEHEYEVTEHIFIVDTLNFLDKRDKEATPAKPAQPAKPLVAKKVTAVQPVPAPTVESKTTPEEVKAEPTSTPSEEKPLVQPKVTVPSVSVSDLPDDLFLDDEDYPC